MVQLGSKLDLVSAFASLPHKAIVVIEDVDSAFSRTDSDEFREANDSTVSFSDLLQALDGAATKSGLIFILTTNHPEHLDPAVVRRVPYRFNLGFIQSDEASAMLRWFYPEATEEQCAVLTRKLSRKKVTPCALQAHFVRSRKKSAQECVEGFSALEYAVGKDYGMGLFQ
jgi:AAA+ superfamily predicted ATPase